MTGTKYLSELVNTESLTIRKLNIIRSPPGSGKTFFALNYIPSLSFNALHSVVYLIDTINGQEQILRNYSAISEYWGWAKDIAGDEIWFEDDRHIVILTYAKFGSLCQKFVDFQSNFDYIVCDELHSLYHFQTFSPKPNYHSLALMGIRSAVRNERTTVIALSATPDIIKQDSQMAWQEIPINQEQLIHYSEDQVIYYTNLEQILSGIGAGEIGLFYTARIKKMLKIQDLAQKNGLSPVCIWSIKNEDHSMTEEQKTARETILRDYKIPEAYNLLIINSSSETSIKIKSPVDYVIVDNTNPDTQTQVRGRVNGDLKRLYLLNDGTKEIILPDPFLDTELFTDGKDRLCEYLNIKSRYRKKYKWPTVKEMLKEQGYKVSDDNRRNNKRYAVISLPTV